MVDAAQARMHLADPRARGPPTPRLRMLGRGLGPVLLLPAVTGGHDGSRCYRARNSGRRDYEGSTLASLRHTPLGGQPAWVKQVSLPVALDDQVTRRGALPAFP